MKEIWLIRHAESQANAGLRTSVPAEVALTERGHLQTEIIARLFKQSPALVVVSPYLRTRQTAKPLLDEFPDVPVQTWEMQEFTYLSQTQTRDSTFAERKPLADAFWTRNDPVYNDGAGAESFADFWQRAKNAIERIITDAPDKTVIFCHAQFLRAMLWQMLAGGNVTPEIMQAFNLFMRAIKIPNAAIVKLLVNNREIYTGKIEFWLPNNLLTY